MKARIEAQIPEANLNEYDRACREFSWAEEERYFTWRRTGRLNIAHEAVDRWVEDPEQARRPALIFEKGGRTRTYTWLELKAESSRLANALKASGLGAGDLVFIFLPPSAEIHIAMLACARIGLVFAVLYASLKGNELETRFAAACPRAVLTHPELVDRLPREVMGGVETVLLISGPGEGCFPHETALEDLLPRMPDDCPCEWLPGRAPLFLAFTSGAAGPPKGVVHAHQAMTGYRTTARDVLDLIEGDVLWTDSEPAWITGTVYGAFAPWLCGVTTVVQGDPFSASTWYRTMERYGVSVWYTSPRIVKGLAEAGQDLPGRYELFRLRHVASVGRTLAPDLFFWVRQHLKVTPHETWWMAETGMICLANFPSLPTKPGSMGRPVPGVEAGILDENGEALPLLSMGQLALRVGWPALMTGLWNDEDRFRDYLRYPGWFLAGDLAVRDEDGYFFHHGRNDDLLKVGEKLVGPFEVEQVLSQHPAVDEAAVISKKNRSDRPVIKAFVKLNPGSEPSARTTRALQDFVRANLSPDTPLEEVEYLDELPKTRTGRILRRVLRASELGLATRDPSRLMDVSEVSQRECDLLVKYGTIVDGTGKPGFTGHLAVRDGRILSVQPAGPDHRDNWKAREVVDAIGLVVAPGFIDGHSYADFLLPGDDHPTRLSSLLEQGVTTIVGGHGGFSPAPWPANAGHLHSMIEGLEALAQGPWPLKGEGIEAYFRFLEEKGLAVNLVQLVGHATLHWSLRGADYGDPGPEGLAVMESVVEQAIDAGAFGLSLGLGWEPGLFARIEEIDRLARTVLKRGALLAARPRALARISPAYRWGPFGEAHNLKALRELLALAQRTGVRLQISPLHFVGRKTWATQGQALDLIEAALKRGADVAFDAVPFPCSSEPVLAAYPPWFLEDQAERWGNSRAMIRLGIQWALILWGAGLRPRDVLLSWGGVPELERYEGLSLAELARDMACSPRAAFIRLTRESRGRAICLIRAVNGDESYEEALRGVLTHPQSTLGTGVFMLARGSGNPASLGAFPRFIRRYVRETGLLTMEEAVGKMTGQTARRVGLHDRGAIAPGQAADLVLFDPGGIRDQAGRPSGIREVFINGERVVSEGRAIEGKKAGRVLRRPA